MSDLHIAVLLVSGEALANLNADASWTGGKIRAALYESAQLPPGSRIGELLLGVRVLGDLDLVRDAKDPQCFEGAVIIHAVLVNVLAPGVYTCEHSDSLQNGDRSPMVAKNVRSVCTRYELYVDEHCCVELRREVQGTITAASTKVEDMPLPSTARNLTVRGRVTDNGEVKLQMPEPPEELSCSLPDFPYKERRPSELFVKLREDGSVQLRAKVLIFHSAQMIFEESWGPYEEIVDLTLEKQ